MQEKPVLKATSEHHDTVKEMSPEVQRPLDAEVDLKSGGDVDDEYRAIEKRVIRKLDYTLVPMLWVLYLFNYLDRNNIA